MMVISDLMSRDTHASKERCSIRAHNKKRALLLILCLTVDLVSSRGIGMYGVLAEALSLTAI